MRPTLRVLLIVWASATCAFSFAQADDSSPSAGAAFRRVVHDIIQISGDPEAVRAEKFRKLLADQPEILGWFAEGRDLGTLLEEADLGAVAPEIRSAKDLAAFAGERFFRDSQRWLDPLPKELGVRPALLHKLFGIGPVYRLSRLRGRRLQSVLTPEQRELLKRTVELHSMTLAALRDNVLRSVASMPTQTRLQLLENLGDSPFEFGAKKVEQAVGELKFSELSAIRMLSDPKLGFSVEGLDEGTRKFLEGVMTQYFDVLDVADKRRMILSVLALPPGASEREQLLAALHASGPVIQKSLQLFAKDAKGSVVRSVAEQMLSSIRPDPTPVRELVEKALGRPVDEVFSELGDQPIKSATIGQVHRARLKDSGEWVAVKVRRPGIRERLLREIETLRKLDPSSVYQNFISRLSEAIEEELDFRMESRYLEQGQVYADARLGITMRGRPALPLNEGLLVSYWASGKPVSAYGGRDLVVVGRALSHLLERWCDEAVFGSGFFHGDMHADNLFLELKPATRLGYELTPIDFGSAGNLSLSERRGFAEIYLAMLSGSPDEVMAALPRVARIPKEGLDFTSLREKVAPLLKEKSLGDSERLERILAAAFLEGLEFPPSLLKFQRGMMFLIKQVKNINRELDRIDPKRALKRYDPIRPILKVVLKRGVPDVYRQLIGKTAEDEAIIPVKSLKRALLGQRGRVLAFLNRPVESCRVAYARAGRGALNTLRSRR